MIHCGTLDDVFSYEKMKHDRGGDESPPPGHSSRLTSLKTMSFRRSPAPQSPPPAKLGGNKKSSPFRWIFQHSDGSSSNTAAGTTHNRKESTPSSLSPRRRTKEPSKRIGFVDIMLGYHTLLQASPGFPVTKQRKELYPTIGFIQNPDYESQKQ